ncbi:MAG: hypothetical protein CVU05_00365 [Bacteroidetes bacterium HGW-Bacteroidetes-21]|jgi:tetratricopeptide (TPR) repeat protein|nr:MAG: hypothetical protein CVU05_00365 [Bacteroidetes bacterium HGW-Bacteroidetes-21]
MKLIFTSLVLILFSIAVCAQTQEETLNSFYQEYQAQNFTSAVTAGNQYLQKSTIKDTTYLDVLRYLAFSYYNLQDYPMAVEKYEQCQKLCADLKGKENYEYIMATFNLAVNYTYVKKYSLAFPLMEEVMAFIEKDQTKHSMDYINTGIQQANIYNLAGSFDLAASVYEDIFSVVKSEYTETDSLYQQMVNIIAPFYLQNGRYDKAEPFYVSAVSIMENVYGKKHVYYLLTLNSLGEFYLYAGMYAKMEKVFAESVTICLDMYGKNSADYATALNNLAVSYEKQGKNKEAEELYLQCLKIKAKVYKKESDYYALSLSNLAVLYDNMGRNEEAGKLLEEAIRIYSKVYDESNPNYAVALSNMASVYSGSGKYLRAMELLLKAGEIQQKNYGEKYVGYINTLHNLATIHEELGDYNMAESIYEKVAALKKEVLGASHTDYATTLVSLAHIKTVRGKYSEAEKLLTEALAIQRQAVGENHASYLTCLNSLAGLYSYMGNYQLSGELYQQCKIGFELTFGDMHPEYATFLNNMGLYYFESGQYNEAENALKKSLDIQQKAYGKDHPDNVNMLTNLANVMMKIGNNRMAEEYLMESNRIVQEKLGLEHPSYVTSILSLGVFNFETGNYEKAENFYLEALEKSKALKGEVTEEYATILSNLGALYLAKIMVEENETKAVVLAKTAESYLLSSLRIDSLLYGSDHPDYISHLNNLAEFYRNTNQFEQAEKLYLKVIEAERKKFGESFPPLAVIYHNLGLLYNGAGMNEKAEDFCKKSLALKKEVYGENSTACSDVLSSLAYVYESSGNFKDAEACYKKALKLNYEMVRQNFAFLSEEEKTNYLTTLAHYNDMFAAFVLKNKALNPSATSDLYSNLLINKGILLRSSGEMKNKVFKSNDKALIQKYNEWIGFRQQLAKLYTMPEKDRFESVSEVEEKANRLEKELVAVTSDPNDENESFYRDGQTVQKSLKEKEAAIEFGHFKRLEKDNTYSDNYYALIVRSDQPYPLMLELFNVEAFAKVFGTYKGNNLNYISGLYFTPDLYRLIWQLLEPYLNGIFTLYIAPDGLLHKVAFASVKTPKNLYLSDMYSLNIVSSTFQVCNKNEGNVMAGNPDAAIFGGALYSSGEAPAEGWKYLEGTLTEAQQIQKICSSQKVQNKVFTGEQASEENIKALVGKSAPTILHIATHGFFYPDPNETNVKDENEAPVLAEVTFRGGTGSEAILSFLNNPNPLLRSGLALSGANSVWTSTSGLAEDGILTAYEVSNINLSKVRLVVLSACETGLGDIKGSEGVYGLQRAFKMAGVKYIVMSLWQVPDKETVEFMETFYTKLLKSKDIRKSFSDTQKEMRKKYDPYYWAAFVLVE